MPNTQTPAQRAAYNRLYAANPVNKAKIYARNKLGWFVRSGKLVRQPCEKCGAEKTHGHHDDYSKPLDVRWLCSSCHAAEHPMPKFNPAARPPRTHCALGHELTGENIFRIRTTYYCRQCNRRRQRELYWQRKAAQNSTNI